MRQLTTRVFEEQLSADKVGGGKDIEKERHDKQRNHAAILRPKKEPIRNQKPALLHDPKCQCQEHSGCCEQSSSKHLFESFVFSEICNAQPQWIDRNH